MQSQQKAENDLLRVYGRLVAICLILIVMSIIGLKYFAGLPQLAARGIALEHDRFLNVLVMVRSQWLSLGNPPSMRLEWEVTSEDEKGKYASSSVAMNLQGWPQPQRRDNLGCQQLWLQLMGGQGTLTAEYLVNDNSCHYLAANGDSIGYQLNSGRVIFLTKE